jgi:hypothetical protein
MLFVCRKDQTTVLNKTVQRSLKIAVAVRNLGKCIFPQKMLDISP